MTFRHSHHKNGTLKSDRHERLLPIFEIKNRILTWNELFMYLDQCFQLFIDTALLKPENMLAPPGDRVVWALCFVRGFGLWESWGCLGDFFLGGWRFWDCVEFGIPC